MKLLAQCHLFCCRACWLLYFISCNQGCFCLPRVIYRVGGGGGGWGRKKKKEKRKYSPASKTTSKLSNRTTVSLLHNDILLFWDPQTYENKSTFLDFTSRKTWEQFQCHTHVRFSDHLISDFLEVRWWHRHVPLAARSQFPRSVVLLAPRKLSNRRWETNASLEDHRCNSPVREGCRNIISAEGTTAVLLSCQGEDADEVSRLRKDEFLSQTLVLQCPEQVRLPLLHSLHLVVGKLSVPSDAQRARKS